MTMIMNYSILIYSAARPDGPCIRARMSKARFPISHQDLQGSLARLMQYTMYNIGWAGGIHYVVLSLYDRRYMAVYL